MAQSSPVSKGSSFRQIIHAAVSWLMMTLSVVLGGSRHGRGVLWRHLSPG